MQMRRTLSVFRACTRASAASRRGASSTAALAGIVRDQQNLPVPAATVTVAGTESSFSRTATTGSDGDFDFPGLLPGEYLITVELTGFERQQLRILLEVNQRVRTDVVLRAGSLTQQVDVIQTVPLLHTSDAVVGEVIDQRQVAELPLNGRQFLELALLVPGAHSSHGAQMGDMSPLYWRPGRIRRLNIAGARPNYNVYLLDGTVNTDPSFNTFVISLPPDSIREFQIQTGTYTAELGAGTGQINVVTRSGTFKPRGSLYEYARNSKFDSPEFTNPDELPPFSQNQFGGRRGSLGRRFSSSWLRGCAHPDSRLMFVTGTAVRLAELRRHAHIRPRTNRAKRLFNPRCRSPANPQVSGRSSRTTSSRRTGSIRSPRRSCRNTSCSRTATTRRTTISTHARTRSGMTRSTSVSIDPGRTARRCSVATA